MSTATASRVRDRVTASAAPLELRVAPRSSRRRLGADRLGLLPGSSGSASATSGSGFHITVSTFVAPTARSTSALSCGRGTTSFSASRDDRGGSRSPPTPSTPAPAAKRATSSARPPSIGSVTTTAATLPFRLLSGRPPCPPAPTPATPAWTSTRPRRSPSSPASGAASAPAWPSRCRPARPGWWCPALAWPRGTGSRWSTRPGMIDAGYRGELRVLLLNTDRAEPFAIAPRDRIAQLLVVARRPARADCRGHAGRQRARPRRLRLRRAADLLEVARLLQVLRGHRGRLLLVEVDAGVELLHDRRRQPGWTASMVLAKSGPAASARRRLGQQRRRCRAGTAACRP